MPIKSLAEIAESVQYGYTASASDAPVGPHLLRITDIVPSQIDWETVPYCEIDEKDKDRFSLAPGDIVIARTGATVGYAKLIRDNPEAVFASYLVRVRVDPKHADPGYVGRMVESDVYKKFVISRVGGAAQPNANAKVLSAFRLPIPDRTTQARIVEVLSAYDNLIENNRRRIQLLEQAARLLYKEWFVHLRFPGHEHVKIKDGVPEGWEKTLIGNVSSFISRGITPTYDDEALGTVINQKCIRDQRVSMDFARRQSKEVTPNKLVRYGDVLVNSTGQGTLGRVAQFLDAIENCTVDSHITIARPDENVPIFLYGHHIASMEEYLASMGRGATNQTELSKDVVAEITFLRPPHLLVEQFELFAKENADQVCNLTQQNTMLTKARDLLLPRLMNGELAA